MTKIEQWILKINESNGEEDYVTRQQLSTILGVSEGKIDYDIKVARRLKRGKLGPENSRCEVRIDKKEAIKYVKSFDFD